MSHNLRQSVNNSTALLRHNSNLIYVS